MEQEGTARISMGNVGDPGSPVCRARDVPGGFEPGDSTGAGHGMELETGEQAGCGTGCPGMGGGC